jgi:hypothetical protein
MGSLCVNAMKAEQNYLSRERQSLSSKNETPISGANSDGRGKSIALGVGQQHVGAMTCRSFPHTDCAGFGGAAKRYIFGTRTGRAALRVEALMIHGATRGHAPRVPRRHGLELPTLMQRWKTLGTPEGVDGVSQRWRGAGNKRGECDQETANGHGAILNNQ